MDKHFKVGIVMLLVLLQVFMFCKVLMLNTSASVSVYTFFGIPLALACAALLIYKPHLKYLDMTMSMFAAGGLGMFIGYAIDIDNLGLNGPFGLMSICRSAPEAPLSVESLWFMLESTPWMYLGMFAGGNAGMLLFLRLRQGWKFSQKQCVEFALCNIGMLLGMLSAHILSMTLTKKLELFWGNAIMISFMLIGMIIGMLSLLYLSTYVKKVFQLAYGKQQIA
ncbi:hypothetical protein GCM10009133_25050 [Cocleimonas flava]|uniref:Uncharacterized protein n=1 Tax=Cocleimonas flava TaxID=634765 RepID=A0A4R1ETG9_9GAMM|nr:hypothetical protein [Cocleimonas flava]TCJ83039.1 hypothetical protein EV695_3777 [Cocleimonas flava]